MSAPRNFLRFSPLLRQNLQAQVSLNVARQSKRMQSTVAAPDAQSGFARFWNSPVGPKTVHFWAPVFKWGLVLAGIADLARPAEQLSLSQNAALVATGAIWTRWCFVIKPKNYALAAVNFFLFLTGSTQVARIINYNSTVKHESIAAATGDALKEEGQAVKALVKDPVNSVKVK